MLNGRSYPVGVRIISGYFLPFLKFDFHLVPQFRLVWTVLCDHWYYPFYFLLECTVPLCGLMHVARNVQCSVFGVWCVKHSVPRYHCTNRIVLQFYLTNFNLHVRLLSLWNLDGIDIVCKCHGLRQYMT